MKYVTIMSLKIKKVILINIEYEKMNKNVLLIKIKID